MALNPLQQAMADGEVESQRFSVSSVAEDLSLIHISEPTRPY